MARYDRSYGGSSPRGGPGRSSPAGYPQRHGAGRGERRMSSEGLRGLDGGTPFRGADFGWHNDPYVEARVNPHVRRLHGSGSLAGAWQRRGTAPGSWSGYAWEYEGGVGVGRGFSIPAQADRRIGGERYWDEHRGPRSGRGPRRRQVHLDMSRAPQRYGGPPSARGWHGAEGPSWRADDYEHFQGNWHDSAHSGRAYRY